MGIQMNEDRWCIIQQSLDVTSVDANTSAERDFTVPGLKVGDFVQVNKPSLSAGLVVGNARVKAANTLSITYGNLTGTPINREQWKLLQAGNVPSGQFPGLPALGIVPRPLDLFLDRWMVRYRKHGRFGVAKTA